MIDVFAANWMIDVISYSWQPGVLEAGWLHMENGEAT